ncbi:asparagine synthase-related protein [Virgibacillus salexigens]|uniref:asparagine synthase-related protein n=1 Tax=Virgibacillus TaxID=84406 RepID=UPI00136FB12B|nr:MULTISPECIES: asparagine synthase-related protein [Virgibacillus]MYL40669.1 hypothetical protein [Virgibacillus massiliensis]
MSNWPIWLTTQEYIGSQYPYYSMDNEEPFFSLNFNEVLKNSPIRKPELELQSVIEILMRSYVIGDKTLIKSIKRAPWLAKYNELLAEWEYFEVPPHDKKIIDPKEAAIKLKEIVYEEILDYIGDAKRVGILLSGGMDSRILAGVLRETQINKDFNGDIIVYNWGVNDSRDVWYAKRIANIFHWDYKHFPLDPDTLKENFHLVHKVGAEIIPYNLHAMNAVAKDTDTDIILAGSYGDTLGRAEYNGTSLSNAPPVVFKNANKLGLLNEELVQEYYEKMKKDSMSYRNSIDKHNREEYQYRETEYQRNHARRYLTTAMSIIAMEKPLFQLFTSPKVVRFLWGLDLSIRSDILYENILPLLPGEISDIPWARTGKVFGSEENVSEDNGRPSSHHYGTWLRNDLRSFIEKELDFDLLMDLGIFNEKSLIKIYKMWPKATTNSVNKIDSTISWLTVFSMFLKKYHINTYVNYENSFKDRLNALIIPPKIRGYQTLRSKLRK